MKRWFFCFLFLPLLGCEMVQQEYYDAGYYAVPLHGFYGHYHDHYDYRDNEVIHPARPRARYRGYGYRSYRHNIHRGQAVVVHPQRSHAYSAPYRRAHGHETEESRVSVHP